ncbi:hypothetical protein ACFXPI_11230 [Streptomyces sp. NPDC059104]|uniref:hypothetical protein n=1 Tax=Streptomyces sp. NPDC059104 TaxID=3346729 RepID=UPI00369243E3
MGFRIDRVVGAEGAAALINRYRAELREQDLLPDKVALAIACEAYADGNVYVVARPGQVWIRRTEDETEPRLLRIVSVTSAGAGGHTAFCQEPLGIFHIVPLSRLGEEFVLTEWPVAARI